METIASKGTDIIRLRDKYEVCLPLFEGPMDLLLHLIRKQEIDIYDIPISLITEQYLEYIRLMRDLNVNVAGEFLEMAATLIYIKSRMLLPAEPIGEDEMFADEDPRMELVERLLEYEKFKHVAQEFYTHFQIESNMWNTSRLDEVICEEEPLVSASLFDLASAFHKLLKRHEDLIALEMEREEISVVDKIEYIKEMLKNRRTVRFSHFLQRKISRPHIVVLFIAILELARMRFIHIKQDDLFSDIIIVRKGKIT